MIQLPWLEPDSTAFPCTSQALAEPNGLLAAGGSLSVHCILSAYQRGIFPWFNEGEPILWWSPSPRTVIYPDQLHISRSLHKAIRKGGFSVSVNLDFDAVVAACAEPRRQQSGDTWISPDIQAAYNELHLQGYAHSVEVWQNNTLVGGIYGIALGHVFFGESMFSRMTNGSKIALVFIAEHLKQWHYRLIDCQVYNDHLARMGAVEIPRDIFERELAKSIINTPAPTLSANAVDISSPWQQQWLTENDQPGATQ